MRMAHNLLSTAWVISWSGRMRYGPPQAFAIAFSRLPSTLSPLQVWATRSCDWKTKSLAHPSNCDLEKTKPSADEITPYTIWEPWCFLASGGKISLCIWCERGHVLQLEMVGRLDALKLRCLWMKPYRNDVENYGLQVPAPKIASTSTKNTLPNNNLCILRLRFQPLAGATMWLAQCFSVGQLTKCLSKQNIQWPLAFAFYAFWHFTSSRQMLIEDWLKYIEVHIKQGSLSSWRHPSKLAKQSTALRVSGSSWLRGQNRWGPFKTLVLYWISSLFWTPFGCISY